LKTNLTNPGEMVCLWKKRTRWSLPSRGSQFNTPFFLHFEKNRPIPRRVFICRGFNDNYHV